MKKSKFALFLLLQLFVAVLFAAAEYKIATVDINKLLNESKEAKTLKSELDKLSQNAKKKIEAERDAIQAEDKKLQEAKADQDSEAAQKLRSRARDYSRFVKDTEDELKGKFFKANKDLTEKALGKIRAYAEKKSIDLVLDKSEGVRGPILFRTPGVDITPDIMKEIGG